MAPHRKPNVFKWVSTKPLFKRVWSAGNLKRIGVITQVLATLLAAVAAFEASRATTLSRDQLQSSRRAWVAIDGTTGHFENGSLHDFQVQVKNYGGGPSLETRGIFYAFPAPKDISDSELTSVIEANDAIQKVIVGSPMAPTQGDNWVNGSIDNLLPGMDPSSQQWFVRARFNYKTIDGAEHVTGRLTRLFPNEDNTAATVVSQIESQLN